MLTLCQELKIHNLIKSSHQPANSIWFPFHRWVKPRSQLAQGLRAKKWYCWKNGTELPSSFLPPPKAMVLPITWFPDKTVVRVVNSNVIKPSLTSSLQSSHLSPCSLTCAVCLLLCPLTKLKTPTLLARKRIYVPSWESPFRFSCIAASKLSWRILFRIVIHSSISASLSAAKR